MATTSCWTSRNVPVVAFASIRALCTERLAAWSMMDSLMRWILPPMKSGVATIA